MDELTELTISRIPTEEHIDNGGTYVSNFLSWRVSVDGEKIRMDEILRATASTANHPGEITWLDRDEDGFPIVTDGEPSKTITQHSLVAIEGRKPECTSCSENTRLNRQKQPWWNL